jgi:hypothetical protein
LDYVVGTTTNSGTFSFQVNTPATNPSVQAYVYAIAMDDKVLVKDASTFNPSPFVQGTPVYTCNSCVTLSLGVTDVPDSSANKGFFIFDQLGATTLSMLAGIPWTPTWSISVLYPTSTGSYYDPSAKTIYMAGGGAAPDDGYYPSPIIHEYGRAVMDML